MSKDEPEVKAGTEKKNEPAPEQKPKGPPKSIFREYLESFAVTLGDGDLRDDVYPAGGHGPNRLDAEHDPDRRLSVG